MVLLKEKPIVSCSVTPNEMYLISSRRMRASVVGLPMVWETPLRTGNLRDPNGEQSTFASESFMDELAAAAKADPAGFGEHGSYKIPFFVPRGSTVTVTIDPPARGHVVIDNPYARHGVTAAIYRPCANVTGFFAQGFAFTDGKIRGCVPLEVRVGGRARVQRVTLSLFAGSCAA